VFNAAGTLPELVREVARILTPSTRGFEVILVDDGSQDASWQTIVDLANAHPFVRGIELMRNYGQHPALLCGIRAACGEVIVTIDDDLQHPPGEIPVLLAALSSGVDVVYGVPERERHDLWRRFTSRATKFALRTAMGVAEAPAVSAFRAFRCELRESFTAYAGGFVSIDVLLTWGTTRFASVVTRHDPRRSGTSGYRARALVAHAVNMVTGFSSAPLQWASLAGFGFIAFGFAVLAYVIGRYLIEGGSVPGFPFLACLITIFAGAQLFSLGIMGEYLARMHFRMMSRPAYAIRCEIGEVDETPDDAR
jgi:undecaprenyl-phosphate 4-deoxy-4-formamido-L-arabinose transferase